MTRVFAGSAMPDDNLRHLIDASPLPMALVDAKGNVDYLNRKFLETFGYPHDEIRTLDAWWVRAYPDQDERQRLERQWCEQMMAVAGEGGEFPPHEAVVTCRDGMRRTIEWRATHMNAWTLVIGTDLTERVAAEERQRALEAQLKQAQKMEAIGTLAGGIAHDFNNILAGILGSIQLAEHELPGDAPARPLLERATRACLRARDLVAKILTFSRRGEPQRKVQAVTPLVREAVGLLRASLPATIDFHSSFTTEPTPVLCDAGQVHQIIMNLGANGAHAMRERGGALAVTVEVCAPEAAFLAAHPAYAADRSVCITISDTGTGMDDATRERIFEPFFTTKPVGEGTGLGLALVHGIVEDYGGGIVVKSELHVGTTFRIYLPIATTPAAAGSTSPFAPPSGRGTGQRLLFVDDEADVVSIATHALTLLGYRPTTFTQPVEALAAFRRDPSAFDAVVSDLTMPGMSGADLIAEIRSKRPDLPALVMTGYLRGADAERIRALGVTSFLEKPFTLATLAGALHTLFTPH
jgi:PAS domain S-box-containing protein